MFVIRILTLYLVGFCFQVLVYARPLKVFVRGYNSRTLPPGGWTHWFNVDHPDGAGDFETYNNIVRMYGRSCMGIPCRRPLAIKAVSIYGGTPNVNGDRVRVSPRHGLTCNGAHQYNFRCQDYKVRFYCPNLHLKCSASRFYPHHHHLNNNNNSSDVTTTHSPPEIEEKKAKRKELRLNRKQLEFVENNGVQKPSRRILKRRARMRSRSRKNKMAPTTTTTESGDVYQPKPTFLTYHPRHPLFQ